MGTSFQTKVRIAFTTDNLLFKILLAEFLGTLVLVGIGDSSVAQKVLSRGGSGEFISVNIAWGLAVSMGVWISGAVSGGHINPAVTLALCIMGRCPWKQLPIYWIGQYLGAFVASAIIFGVYYEAMHAFDDGIRAVSGVNATAGIWATYPIDSRSVWGGLGDQMFSTSLLVMLILAITDDNNMKPPKGMVPFCVGLIVMVIGLSLGHNCGYAINPARDLAPRAFTALAGWGMEVFTYEAAGGIPWSWVPVVGPHIGAIIGAWMYLIFIGNHIRPGDKSDHLLDKMSENMELTSANHHAGSPGTKHDQPWTAGVNTNHSERTEHKDPAPDYDVDINRANPGSPEYRGSPNRGYTDDRYDKSYMEHM